MTQAVREFSPDAEAGRDQMALVSTGGAAHGHAAQRRFGLDSTSPDSVWPVRTATRAIFDGSGLRAGGSSTLDRQIVLIRTGAEGSGNTMASVRRALMDSHVTLSVIDAAPNSPDAATLSGWAADSGGVYVASAPNKLLGLAMVNARLGGRYSLTAPVELTNDRSNVSVVTVLSRRLRRPRSSQGSLLTTHGAARSQCRWPDAACCPAWTTRWFTWPCTRWCCWRCWVSASPPCSSDPLRGLGGRLPSGPLGAGALSRRTPPTPT
ncbi:MAG: hypothetical protein R2704_09645 [Microthrixaceae bacterium]